ncbi:unnamed protein product [Clonostachys byssicola]|uniref:Uncharacterized protein n=1 Tax=Clonostachys byssicola TaxID=160290 RepID=A0A9N9YAA7_9HYPO|nr:unnamed protein product [Clonostachys byssicola]
MRVASVLAQAAIVSMAMAAALPHLIQSRTDADEAVVYPASVDQSWVDANVQRRSGTDSDEAVVYPASVDQSWVDATSQKRSGTDSDEAVVYPASVDQSWVDAKTN